MSCIEDNYLLLDGTTCDTTCPDGTFKHEEEARCLPCSSMCATCEFEPYHCLTCPDDPHKVLMVHEQEHLCLDHCWENFYENSSSECVRCDANCRECEDPGTECTACWFADYNASGTTTNADIFLSDGACVDACPAKYYANPVNECVECDDSCATCEHDKHNCTSCDGDYLFMGHICVG